ncbi:MAG TPA: hypothetical protein VN701_00805 [Candidatus Paceibacterota bacterium]|nr:hypothetical protein [Candidatus Paceibacterota bacterium]
MFKFIAVIVVIVVAAAALWYTGLLSSWVPSIPSYQQMMSPATTTPQTATTTQQAQTQPQAVNDLPTQPNDASDDAIAKDAASIDAQMSALSTDDANAQNSTNDTPVSQDY